MGPGSAVGLLLLCSLGGAVRVLHSLRYFSVAVSDPSPGVPWYQDMGYVDGIPFVHYDSKSRRYQPRTQWIEANVDQEYWDGETQIGRSNQQINNNNLDTLQGRYNQSGGAHTLQRMAGCDLLDDGSTKGYRQDAYDGKDFIAFDMDTMGFIAADVAAQVTKRKWEHDGIVAERLKNYLENTCVEWLKNYVRYGQLELERRGHGWLSRWRGLIPPRHPIPSAPHGASVREGGRGWDPDPDLPRSRLLPAAHRAELAEGRRGAGPGHSMGQHRTQQRRHLLHVGLHRGQPQRQGQVPVPGGTRQPPPTRPLCFGVAVQPVQCPAGGGCCDARRHQQQHRWSAPPEAHAGEEEDGWLQRALRHGHGCCQLTTRDSCLTPTRAGRAASGGFLLLLTLFFPAACFIKRHW